MSKTPPVQTCSRDQSCPAQLRECSESHQAGCRGSSHIDEAVHEALAQPNSPVVQGLTVRESAKAFLKFVFDSIVGTPVSLEKMKSRVHWRSLPSQPIYDVGLGRKVRQGRMWGRMGETG